MRRVEALAKAITQVRPCGWTFKSGWSKGLTCNADAWNTVQGEPRCRQHIRAKAAVFNPFELDAMPDQP